MPSEDLQRRLPLLPAVFHIMLALADGERHGYGIKREVEFRTGGVVSLGPGTLYGTLQKMLAQGLIEECGEHPSEHPSKHTDTESVDVRRRYYRLTAAGRRLAAAEAERLENLVRVAWAKDLLTGRGTA